MLIPKENNIGEKYGSAIETELVEFDLFYFSVFSAFRIHFTI